MKNLYIKLIAFLLIFMVFSCRNADDIPEDIHEHEEIEKLVVTITNTANDKDIQTINYIGGKADKEIELIENNSYEVKLDFQVKHDDHYHSANHEIEEEKDEHFIIFEFANSDITITRVNDDLERTDGNKVGLKTIWKINTKKDNSAVAISLNHGAESVDQNFPNANDQKGKVIGGETDVNARINIK